jgi:uncharacterized protein DUF1419
MELRQIEAGIASRDRVVSLINRHQSRSLDFHLGFEAGQWFEIEEAEYWYFFGILAPIGHTGGSYAMAEFTKGQLTDSFHQIGTRFFCALIEWTGPASVTDMRDWLTAEV